MQRGEGSDTVRRAAQPTSTVQPARAQRNAPALPSFARVTASTSGHMPPSTGMRTPRTERVAEARTTHKPLTIDVRTPHKPPIIDVRTPRTLKLAVVGGSISYGYTVPGASTAFNYGALTAMQLGATLHNAAVPATTSAHAAFCLNTLVPRQPDVLIVEYTMNDVLGVSNPAGEVGAETVDGVFLHPRSHMERLLRRAWTSWPRTTVLLLSLCVPLNREKCRSIYGDLPAVYSTQPLLHLQVDMDPAHLVAPGIHPDNLGHQRIAAQVVAKLRQSMASIVARIRGVTRPVSLPPPRALDPKWEEVDARWRCLNATQMHPVHSRGFKLGVGEITQWRKDKLGWLSNAPGDEVTFSLGLTRCGTRVLVVMLCAATNERRGQLSHALQGAPVAGVAQLTLRTAASEEATAQVVDERRIDLKWQCNSSQQCLHRVVSKRPGSHTVAVRVLKPAGFVVLYGIYDQPMMCATH